MKYAFIRIHSHEFRIERMCQVLKVSRSGYYSYYRRELSGRAQENQVLLDKIKIAYKGSRGCYGSPRIHAELCAQGDRYGRHRIARMMRTNDIRAKTPRRAKYNPFVHQDYPIGTNHLQRRFSAANKNRVWVSDITYMPTNEGWLYLAVILDIFSRRVVGYAMSDDQRKNLVIAAWDQATQLRQPPRGLIFHSDRGMQYTSDSFQDRLLRHGAISSMSRKGNCYDNAVAESFFHTLKTELMYRMKFRSREEARRNLFEYIVVFYNNKRRHSYLNYLTPAEFEDIHGSS